MPSRTEKQQGDANRANATFYTVDPRGLPVFDTPIGPEPPPTIVVDAAILRRRTDTLRTLAENTDGMTVQGSNDLDIGLKRIANDLSSYYLLGYLSSNAKLAPSKTRSSCPPRPSASGVRRGSGDSTSSASCRVSS